MEKIIKIISDSSCDLPKELIKQQGIDIIPVPITDGVNNYQDSVNITADEVYENMKKSVIYKTSQVPLKDYIEKYTYYAQNDIPALSLTLVFFLSHSEYLFQKIFFPPIRPRPGSFELSLLLALRGLRRTR